MGKFSKISIDTHHIHHHRIPWKSYLLYAIFKGLPIDVRKIIEREIRECAMKNHKTTALLFPSLITRICLVFQVKISAKDESIKNEWALTARIVKRIARETTAAATLDYVVVTRAMNITGIEMKLQELSDTINECVHA